MADTKNTMEHVEDFEKPDGVGDTIGLPPALSTLSEDEIRRLGRKTTLKLDLMIMPALVIMYILNYLDRQNIAASRLAGIEESLSMSDTQYNTTVSILFVGYSKSLPSRSECIADLINLVLTQSSCKSPAT